jgi:hypothetical protein
LSATSGIKESAPTNAVSLSTWLPGLHRYIDQDGWVSGAVAMVTSLRIELDRHCDTVWTPYTMQSTCTPLTASESWAELGHISPSCFLGFKFAEAQQRACAQPDSCSTPRQDNPGADKCYQRRSVARFKVNNHEDFVTPTNALHRSAVAPVWQSKCACKDVPQPVIRGSTYPS